MNDISWEKDAAATKEHLKIIVEFLKVQGKKVLIQSIPPFSYSEKIRLIWEEVNEYVKKELAPKADAFFDNVPILSPGPEEPHIAKYGGHPNAVGCTAWAKALAPVLKELL